MGAGIGDVIMAATGVIIAAGASSSARPTFMIMAITMTTDTTAAIAAGFTGGRSIPAVRIGGAAIKIAHTEPRKNFGKRR